LYWARESRQAAGSQGFVLTTLTLNMSGFSACYFTDPDNKILLPLRWRKRIAKRS